ncbi:MAG: hypothetical protein QOH81_1093 [Sphingomonadales bacterium]|jgi:hypothetical protein|nr:hypothetical protein [Sphingomonadales bacterium]
MAVIDVDFEVYKKLTVMRPDEATTYNDVLRRMLGLDEPKSDAPARAARPAPGGCEFKGVSLPNGTELRVTYKGRTYTAQIKDGSWIGEDGIRRNSPSDAACAITKSNVNGWRFWKVRRPGDGDFRVLEDLRPRL